MQKKKSLKKPRAGGGKKVKMTPKPKMFWRMKPNPELDRSGEWILRNLAYIRGRTDVCVPVP